MAKLLESFDVDDLVCEGNNEKEAYEHYTFAKEALSQASFNLRKFATRSLMLREANSHQAKDSHVSDVTYIDVILSPDQLTLLAEHKVLGVCWNVWSDQLIFELSTIAETTATLVLVPTKRTVISLIGHSCDPLGFLSPITIRFKALIQELCN